MASQPRTPDRIVAAIANRQHGIVTRAQLLAAGLSSDAVQTRIERGSLIGVHRGIYRVGHAAPSVEADYLAATLAGGADSLVCGRAAAHLLRVIRGDPPAPVVVSTRDRQIPGLTTRRTRRLGPADRTRFRGIPVTSLPRTLVDLAAELPAVELARVFHEGRARYGLEVAAVELAIARRGQVQGIAELRAALYGDSAVTLSTLERRFLRLLRAEKLPPPQTNVALGRGWIDCHWPEFRLTVELDSYRYHASRQAWEADRRRERVVRARGDEFRRYTYGDVAEHPEQMLSELRTLLTRPAPQGAHIHAEGLSPP